MSERIEVYDPGNGELVGTVPSANLEDVERVLATASAASEVARNLPTHLRIPIGLIESLWRRHGEWLMSQLLRLDRRDGPGRSEASHA